MYPLNITSAVPTSPPNNINRCRISDARRSVTYHPSVWGNHFLRYTSHVITEISVPEKEELERQKETVRNLLTAAQMEDDSLVHKLQLIDAIQRLGVAYHFEDEIEKSLRRMYDGGEDNINNNDLHFVALRFRLLRQQGHHVPCDVFNKFIDEEGDFKESITANNVQGVLSLYEAAHLAIDGEDILDKAISFCTSFLESYLVDQKNNNIYLAKQVSEALDNPIHKSVIRLGARKFISIYQENESHDKTLLNFAKLDFNIVQKIHQKELGDLTRWWKDLDFANKLPFARDRMVECYFWILAVYFEPKYNVARTILTKIIALASIADDIYDVHGTLDELELFTDFIQSWDVTALEQLPRQYMRIYSRALLDVYDEIEDEMTKIGTSYRLHYANEEMKKLMRAYLEEAKWCYSNYTPSTMEEYMKVSLVSAGYMMASTLSLVGMDENTVTNEHFDWITSEPLIVRASSTVARLMDDIVGYECEEKISAVDCYMKENGCSKTEAIAELGKQVKTARKDINKECISTTASDLPIVLRVLNLTRLIDLLYSGEDGYTNSKTKTKEIIKSVLVEPLSIN
ncbi:PREDICTED: LOW QUALITY PROTEIN: germacrene-D synthase-like [Erythranthe guttata]|uniref:LOW QUALITY PROTEIN: germacrene-D synthase-like n=1 Tax=Erythranthe guttata TaxID=4155 RepID=UPI00064E0F24|nr:PREDICTED: LOW QUALITY PROTEIN: germacrene-D synthase-like [Erythranthe guttata]|eukprot:XP_012827395.1 PREDICTED: LOW QUALITY PROTEIN: germacrene-D synthase-like [Erythranthe guttata]